jgi:hypothetical protein
MNHFLLFLSPQIKNEVPREETYASQHSVLYIPRDRAPDPHTRMTRLDFVLERCDFSLKARQTPIKGILLILLQTELSRDSYLVF